MMTHRLNAEFEDATILSLAGVVDFESVSTIYDALSKLFEDNQQFIIIDLSETEKITGVALGELLEWRGKISSKLQGDIALVGASEPLLKLLHEWDVHKVFPIFDRVEEAVSFLHWEYKGLTENIIFSVPSLLELVPPIRTFVNRCLMEKNYSDREAFQIETIIDELCNNAIEHGSGRDNSLIEIAVAIGRDRVEINVANGVDYINGLSSPKDVKSVMHTYSDSPSQSIDNHRGRGLALIKMLASEFDIDSSDDGTCVHVTKYREVK